VKRGPREDQDLLVRSDAVFPGLYQIRRQGRFATPVSYATAHVAALFIKNFPRETVGVLAPEELPAEVRRAILNGVRKHGVKLTHKVTPVKPPDEDAELL
jgi:hypothetical protein